MTQLVFADYFKISHFILLLESGAQMRVLCHIWIFLSAIYAYLLFCKITKKTWLLRQLSQMADRGELVFNC